MEDTETVERLGEGRHGICVDPPAQVILCSQAWSIMTDFLTIEGHRIAYTSAGHSSNPPVLLIHGIMSHRGVWTRTVAALKDRFYCVAFDLLGFGDSDKPNNGDYAIAKQAERAVKVADHFGFEKFTVVGHSMGGQIATHLAAKLALQRVHKLVRV